MPASLPMKLKLLSDWWSENTFPEARLFCSKKTPPIIMYIIVSGKVRVVQLSSEGKERILAIHKRGDYFGELALFDGKTAPATVIAMEESEIGLLVEK